MPDEIQLSMSMGLFVHDADQMRAAAYERTREAWSGDDEFPYGSAEDVPLEVAVHSLLADAMPVDLPGCRRGRLLVESVEENLDDGASDADDSQPDSDGGSDHDSDRGTVDAGSDARGETHSSSASDDRGASPAGHGGGSTAADVG